MTDTQAIQLVKTIVQPIVEWADSPMLTPSERYIKIIDYAKQIYGVIDNDIQHS